MGSVEDNSNAVHARDVIDVLAFGPVTCGVSVTRTTSGTEEFSATCWIRGTLVQVRREWVHLRAQAKLHGLSVRVFRLSDNAAKKQRRALEPLGKRFALYFDLHWTTNELVDYPELQKRVMHVVAEQLLVKFGCHLDPLP